MENNFTNTDTNDKFQEGILDNILYFSNINFDITFICAHSLEIFQNKNSGGISERAG
jgi:hypothetical protein